MGETDFDNPFYKLIVDFFERNGYTITLTSVLINVFDDDEMDHQDFSIMAPDNVNLPDDYFIDDYNFGSLPSCILEGRFRQYNDEGQSSTSTKVYSSNVVLCEKIL